MPLDIFAIARGLKAGQDAYSRGQKEQADMYWSEIENSLKTMASAQGIKFAAEKHPLEVAGMGLQNKAVEAGTKATEQATEQKGITFGQEQEDRTIREKTFRDVAGGPESAVKARSDINAGNLQNLMTKIQTDAYSWAKENGLSREMGTKLLQEIPLDLMAKWAGIYKDLQSSDPQRALSFDQQLKKEMYEYLSQKMNMPRGAIMGEDFISGQQREQQSADIAQGRYAMDVETQALKPIRDDVDLSNQQSRELINLATRLNINELNSLAAKGELAKQFPTMAGFMGQGMTTADAQANAMQYLIGQLVRINARAGAKDTTNTIRDNYDLARQAYNRWVQTAQSGKPNPVYGQPQPKNQPSGTTTPKSLSPTFRPEDDELLKKW